MSDELGQAQVDFYRRCLAPDDYPVVHKLINGWNQLSARLATSEAEREKANGFAERSKASAEKWAGEANDLEDRIAAMQDEWAKTIESQDAIRDAAEAERERLRKIEAAARDLFAAKDRWVEADDGSYFDAPVEMRALRDALAASPVSDTQPADEKGA